jgi:hypothetical protein
MPTASIARQASPRPEATQVAVAEVDDTESAKRALRRLALCAASARQCSARSGRQQRFPGGVGPPPADADEAWGELLRIMASVDGCVAAGACASAAVLVRSAVALAESRVAADPRWEGVLLQLGRFVATHVEGAGLDWWGLL